MISPSHSNRLGEGIGHYCLQEFIWVISMDMSNPINAYLLPTKDYCVYSSHLFLRLQKLHFSNHAKNDISDGIVTL